MGRSERVKSFWVSNGIDLRQIFRNFPKYVYQRTGKANSFYVMYGGKYHGSFTNLDDAVKKSKEICAA